MSQPSASYTWHKVFASEQEARELVPLRKLYRLDVEGRSVCLAHTPLGFFALDDICPHLGHSLSRGTTNYLNEVICPWHSYRYNLESGKECEYRTRNAVQYPVELRSDGVYLGIRQ